MANIKVSTARNRSFLMVQSSDHISALTGATVTALISKNGAAFAAPGGAVTEIGSGWYNIALTTTDTNTFGDLDFHCTATSADPNDFQDQVIAVDFTDAVRLGLSALPNVAASANGGLPTVGAQVPNANAGASSGLHINGTNAGTTTFAGMTVTGGITANIAGNLSGTVGSAGSVTGDVAGKVLGGGGSTITGDGCQSTLRQAQADLVWQSTRYTPETGTAQSGSAANIILRAGASAVDGIFVGAKLAIFAGTGIGQCRVCTAYTGSSKTFWTDQNWTVTPDGTSQYIVIFDDAPACSATQAVVSTAVLGDVIGNVRGNVNGSVAGKVLGGGISALVGVGVQSDVRLWLGVAPQTPNVAGVPMVDMARVLGVAPNSLISGNFPANVQATASTLTVNLTGNLSGSVGSVTGSVGSVVSNVNVGTINDKTGYALTSGEHTQIAADVLDVTAANHNIAGSIGNKISAAASAGDPWTTSLPGSYAAGSAGFIIGNRVDAAISSRMASGNVTVGGYAAGQDPAALVLDVAATSHNTGGSIGAKISSAASAGDPWTTTLPGSYGAGTAGAILGGRLDAAITSRQASFTVPANFGLLSVDGSGRVVLQPSGLDGIVVEPGLNGRQAMCLIAAANAGLLSGATGTNIVIQGANNPTQTRISAVVDANGDRTAISLSLP
jgi:hypothetical protein